jgi:hypothetical protein
VPQLAQVVSVRHDEHGSAARSEDTPHFVSTAGRKNAQSDVDAGIAQRDARPDISAHPSQPLMRTGCDAHRCGGGVEYESAQFGPGI